MECSIRVVQVTVDYMCVKVKIVTGKMSVMSFYLLVAINLEQQRSKIKKLL